jgi:hypothetical protein
VPPQLAASLTASRAAAAAKQALQQHLTLQDAHQLQASLLTASQPKRPCLAHLKGPAARARAAAAHLLLVAQAASTPYALGPLRLVAQVLLLRRVRLAATSALAWLAVLTPPAL